MGPPVESRFPLHKGHARPHETPSFGGSDHTRVDQREHPIGADVKSEPPDLDMAPGIEAKLNKQTT